MLCSPYCAFTGTMKTQKSWMPSFVSRLLYSQTQPVLNAFAKEVQFGQEKCAAKCANCTRIWGKLRL